MLQKRNKTIFLMMLFAFVMLGSMFIIYGCGGDSSTNATADANVVKYDSVDAFPGGKNSVNLVTGSTVSSSDNTKDITVVDAGGGLSFKVQSGNLVPPGYNTMMVLVDSNDTRGAFDAISSVPAWGSTIDPAIFTLSNTGTVIVGRVYGFYLQGKFADGILQNKTYGLFRVNNIATGGGFTIAKVNFNIKYNKTGANKFN